MRNFSQHRSAMRILVVDDDDLVRMVITAVLRNAGHDVESVQNGTEALAQVAETEFELILLDVQMPIMDGWSTIAALRGLGCRAPVVMMSGHATELDALAHGASAFISKPFDSARLIDVVSRWGAGTQGSAAS
ncbi:MAG: response regulator [Dehalococcoidia bacterium]|nr:MAG: response regulator [Dehalococcoidia bacterium]